MPIPIVEGGAKELLNSSGAVVADKWTVVYNTLVDRWVNVGCGENSWEDETKHVADPNILKGGRRAHEGGVEDHFPISPCMTTMWYDTRGDMTSIGVVYVLRDEDELIDVGEDRVNNCVDGDDT